MNSAMVTLDSVGKIFPRAKTSALEGISAVLRSGQITGLVGPDGAGKTTLIRLMAGLLEPSSGSISVGGLDPVRDADALRCLLRALCVLQVCSVRRDSRFGLGASGDWLRCEPPAGAPGFRDMVRWWAGSMDGSPISVGRLSPTCTKTSGCKR